MKTKLILVMSAIVVVGTARAQILNWNSLRQEERNILSVNGGFDYAFSYGIGYGRQLKTKMPAMVNVDFSQPAGKQLFDDFKTKIGAQVRLHRINNIQFIVKIQGVFRRYHNDYVRLLNFGSDMSAVIGYYKPRWFVSGEFGFDKAIVTHFKHTALYRADFPTVKDGWYKPATGGNFYFGIQTGYSFRKSDVTLKLGRVVQEDFQTNPTVPLYVQLGFNRRF